MNLSRTTKQFSESVIREMTRIARKYPGSINLAQGFPDFSARKEIKAAAIEAIKRDINQYSITWGSQSLREAIGRKVSWYNNLEIDPERMVTVTCGATEAMIASLKAVINPGDEVIIFEPFYENYGPDCLLSGANPRYVSLHPPSWDFHLDELERVFTENTKAIIINTPNNPTGKVFSRKELEQVINLCLQHDCIAITDEIYEHIIYDGQEHVSIASLPEMHDHSITINSISKTYSLTGWRVGWTLACEEITAEIKKVHDFLTVGAPAPLQEGAARALAMEQGYYDWLSAFYSKARETIFNAIDAAGLHPIQPRGAYYIMCDCKEYMSSKALHSSMDLAMNLLEEVGIATVPGESFFSRDGKGKSMTRFCFCKKEETLNRAVELLERLH
ncbi:aminotransferase class I/II-fold pyridoxal phosphate-dependent enzyme [Candidatus Bathyarchaeota archaeon]|nr:aminotransferase class I/II-fold pyridoxal phosphate-dependent enzyme [Candidatus Bathyarchaeota archaeon]